MSAITDKRRQRLLDELAKLQQQMDEATAEQRKYESKAVTPDMLIKDRQAQWVLCQLRRGSLDKKIRILRAKLNQLDKPARDAKQEWRDSLTKRLTERLAWREVLKTSLQTHRCEHLVSWSNDVDRQAARVEEAEKRLANCEEGIRQMQQELAENLG